MSNDGNRSIFEFISLLISLKQSIFWAIVSGKEFLMCSNGVQMQKNSVSDNQSSLDGAKAYEQTRFNRDQRMRKIDALEKSFAERLFGMVGPDCHIVDVPCGNGRFFDVFSTAREITMIDYSDNMLTATSERIGQRDNVRMLQSDITSIDLPDDLAELCFCMRLFHHMKNDEVRSKALGELSRISKKYVALSFYNKKCGRYYWRKALKKKIRGNYITLEHICGLANKAGLELLDHSRVNFIEQQSLLIFEKKID